MSNKTSDKNVGNVTKRDIDVLNELINAYEAGLPGCNELMNSEVSAIKNILAELEQMIKEREKYTIRLTDEEYRKVIENAQMDTSNARAIAIKFATMQQQINEKDKRIQELEAKLEFKKFGDLDNVEFEEYMSQFIPTQKVIDKIEAIFTVLYEQYENDYQDIQDVIAKIHGKIKKELLGGENENRA